VHSTVETCHKKDIQATTDLLAAWLEQATDQDYFIK
jgi:putative aminopeptidase FrvX